MINKPKQPKGSMCLSCKNKMNDCSKLPFDKYPVYQEQETFTIVICKEYKRNE